MKIYLGA